MESEIMFITPTSPYCSIPFHAWLVVDIDDFLDDLDPLGIVNNRYRPHEYLPEIPDLLFLLATDSISHDNINAVFDKFFGDSYCPGDYTEKLYQFLVEKRTWWLERIESLDDHG